MDWYSLLVAHVFFDFYIHFIINKFELFIDFWQKAWYNVKKCKVCIATIFLSNTMYFLVATIIDNSLNEEDD